MKKIQILFLFLINCFLPLAHGQSFTIITPSNHLVYFQLWNDNMEAEATYCSYNMPNYGSSLAGTLIIHDTIVTGVDGVEALNAKVYIHNGQIVVEGAEGNTVWLYDAVGRLLATRQDDYSALRFDVPATGTYLIKVGNHPARRVVVVR